MVIGICVWIDKRLIIHLLITNELNDKVARPFKQLRTDLIDAILQQNKQITRIILYLLYTRSWKQKTIIQKTNERQTNRRYFSRKNIIYMTRYDTSKYLSIVQVSREFHVSSVQLSYCAYCLCMQHNLLLDILKYKITIILLYYWYRKKINMMSSTQQLLWKWTNQIDRNIRNNILNNKFFVFVCGSSFILFFL